LTSMKEIVIEADDATMKDRDLDKNMLGKYDYRRSIGLIDSDADAKDGADARNAREQDASEQDREPDTRSDSVDMADNADDTANVVDFNPEYAADARLHRHDVREERESGNFDAKELLMGSVDSADCDAQLRQRTDAEKVLAKDNGEELFGVDGAAMGSLITRIGVNAKDAASTVRVQEKELRTCSVESSDCDALLKERTDAEKVMVMGNGKELFGDDVDNVVSNVTKEALSAEEIVKGESVISGCVRVRGCAVGHWSAQRISSSLFERTSVGIFCDAQVELAVVADIDSGTGTVSAANSATLLLSLRGIRAIFMWFLLGGIAAVGSSIVYGLELKFPRIGEVEFGAVDDETAA